MAKQQPVRKKRQLPSVEVHGIKLTYHRSEYAWFGRVALPTLAAKVDRYPHSKDAASVGWYRMPKDHFALTVRDERRQGPAPSQMAALKLLATKQAKVCREVLRCHTAAAKEAAEGWDEHWDEMAERLGILFQSPARRDTRPDCMLVEVLDLEHKGVAYIDFDFRDDDIDDEHGSHVVWHPTEGAHWTSNAHETIRKGSQVFTAPEPGIHDQLADALYQGHWKKADKLIAQGADVNGFSGEVYPALYYAVANENVALVKRLLAYGIDPNKRGSEKRSVLSEANETLRDLKWAVNDELREQQRELRRNPPRTPAGAKGPPRHLRGVLKVVAKLEEIVRLLKAAGAR